MRNPPSHETLMGVFDNHWSDALWTQIEAERDANGFNLNESIWNIANNAQNKAYAIIRDAEQNGTTFGKVKDALAALLTEKGKANMGYNVKRLWVNQLKADRIIAQRQVWTDMGYIQNVILSRSDHAEPCEICDEEVGEGPLSERVVPLDYGNWPPFHPWCACDARPEKPSAKSIAAFLKGDLGSPDLMALMKGPTIKILPKEPAEPVVINIPVQPKMSNAQKHNADLFQTTMITTAKTFAVYGEDGKTRGWNDNEQKEFFNKVVNGLWGISDRLPPPLVNIDEHIGIFTAAQYDHGIRTISFGNTYQTPTSAAEMMLHEYGHYIMHSVDDGAGVFASFDDYTATRIALTDVLDTIRGYMSELPNSTDIDNDALMTLDSLISFIEPADNVQQLIDAFSDMGMGQIEGFLAHDRNYLLDSFRNINIESTLYGIGEQEALNELWSGLIQYGDTYAKMTEEDKMYGETSINVKEEIENYLPGLVDAVTRWMDFIGRKP